MNLKMIITMQPVCEWQSGAAWGYIEHKEVGGEGVHWTATWKGLPGMCWSPHFTTSV